VKEKLEALLQRTYDSLGSAKLLLDNGYYDPSISRSYYAMFYATEAILLTKNLKFSSHKSVISLLGEHFVRSGIFPSELGRDLSKAFDERLTGDYSFKSITTKGMAEKAVKRAEDFVKYIEEYLIRKGYK
jgi:uncharacterized protein (UPF0332 family)